MAAGVMLADHLAQMEIAVAPVREVTRQVGLHQCTGSCDCGSFVMGCASLCGVCGHNLSTEVKICESSDVRV